MYPNLIATPENLRRLARDFGTPLWVYKWDIVAAQIARLRSFDTIRFAQKACSNIHILEKMRHAGVLVDAVSAGEIRRAMHAGYETGPRRHDIVFTADLMDRETLARILELDVPVNAGSIDMLEQLGMCRPGHRVWLRINPGFGKGHSTKTNTGGSNSKHGIWHADVPRALAIVRRYKLRLEGLHMHIGSGVDYDHLEKVGAAMVELVRRHDVDVPAISAGGGLSTPYREGDVPVDCERYFALWDNARREIEGYLGHRVRLEIEPGRFLVAESGILLAEVRATKDMGENHFVMVDAGFNELMRPAMYGSYHGVSLLYPRARLVGPARPTVVAGPLCESGDVFTQEEGGAVAPIPLPPAHVGDLAVFHDAGAYGASMSSCYNSRPLAPEVLIEGGSARLVRRRQTVAEMISLEQELPGVRARLTVRQGIA